MKKEEVKRRRLDNVEIVDMVYNVEMVIAGKVYEERRWKTGGNCGNC